jgi:hypothetical protein
MRSLTRDEISATFGLDRSVIDALTESGRLLCHLRDGEVRIPLKQLEEFFRDGLMAVYRAQAGEFVQPAAASLAELELPRELQPEPEPEPEPAPPLQVIALPAEPPEPNVREEIVEDEPEPQLPADTRVAPRYIPRRQIDGVFHNVRFSIVQISATGFRIRHNEELLPGDEARLSFALVNAAQSFAMRARVVWTSVAREREGDSRSFYISGLRVTAQSDRLARAIDILKSAHELEPDRRATPRGAAASAPPMAASDEEVAMVMKAVQRFATDPVEASRWQARARFSLSDPEVRRYAPAKPREREEVLAIWEFVERQVDVPKIVEVMSWMRKSRISVAAAT